MSFSPDLKENILVACGRHCAICHKFCGIKIEIHHIHQVSDGGADIFDNAIPLCFDCHADMRSYDPKHPKGTKYTESELKRHRDEWYKKIINSAGVISTNEAIITDKHVFETLAKTLPWNGSIRYIRNRSFAGFPFHNEFLKDFNNFKDICENPAFEFMDTDLEGLRAALFSSIKAFDSILAEHSFPTNPSGFNVIPEIWEIEQPERFWRVLNDLDIAIKGICESYDSVIKLSTRKLGIIYLQA